MARFRELVGEALDSLPPEIAAAMENVEVVVEDEPSADLLAGLGRGHELFGYYHGIPLIDRMNYTAVMPDKIAIYRGPILRAFRAPRQVRDQVRRTVIHEIAHHFGIDDDRLTELGWD